MPIGLDAKNLISIFRVKSNSHKTPVLLILWFSVYRCHGNIDFPKTLIVSNFNLRPVPGVNFTSIRAWKISKWPNENVRYGREKTIWSQLKFTVQERSQ